MNEIYACELCGSSSDEVTMCPACDYCVECCDLNTVTEWMKEEDSDVLTPMFLENIETDELEVIVGTWLMACVQRYSGATFHASRRPGGNTLAYSVTHDGRTVASLTVTGPGARRFA